MPKKRRRNPNGAGSVYQTKDGQWKVALVVPTLTGARKRITRNARSQRHGLMLLDELRRENRSLKIHPGLITVRELVGQWIAGFDGEASTRDGYRNLLDTHIGPFIGGRQVSGMSVLVIQEWIRDRREAEIGARTLQMAFSLLSRCFLWGLQTGLCNVNPCVGVRRPQAKREPIQPFTSLEVTAILQETAGTLYHCLFLMAFTTGMRQGELFGLTWDCVDLYKRTVQIHQQAKDYRGRVTIKKPKTDAGFRSIQITSTLTDALRSHRTLTDGLRRKDDRYVFPSPKGCVTRRTTFGRRVWKPLLLKLGIRHRGAHHMRHTAATMMLTAGVPPHIVAGVLGHSNPETVMTVYAHFIQSDSSLAASAMEHLGNNIGSGSYPVATSEPLSDNADLT